MSGYRQRAEMSLESLSLTPSTLFLRPHITYRRQPLPRHLVAQRRQILYARCVDPAVVKIEQRADADGVVEASSYQPAAMTSAISRGPMALDCRFTLSTKWKSARSAWEMGAVLLQNAATFPASPRLRNPGQTAAVWVNRLAPL